MATKRPTKAVVVDMAAEGRKALELRNQGKSIGDILAQTAFVTPLEVMQGIREYNDALIFEAREDRIRGRQMELEAINMLIERCWRIIDDPGVEFTDADGETHSYAPDYDQIIKAIKAAGDLIQKRIALLGLAKEDARAVGQTTIYVTGDSDDVVAQLQAARAAD